jgi:heme/copper-type cytochrome/quinol oxidase subunit 4
MMICALHDLFVRYISYRNEDEVGVSWDGEGTYSPPFWVSFEGRVLNPLIGPGSRTLTAFGALVPGLVLTKRQWWRVLLAFVESSSLLEMLLHFIALKTAIGGHLTGYESKRGTFVVSLFYVITAFVGSIWSMAVDRERLITSSGMGLTGLLAAVVVEQYWFPSPIKDEDETSYSIYHNDLGGGHNLVSSSTNEQFSFQPMQQKRERQSPVKMTNPTFLLAMEALVSYWAPYQSLAGTTAAAGMGVALALLIFVGKSPDASGLDNKEFHETPPPPPPTSIPGMYRDDDDSADSSFGSGRQPFNTPLMRKSILADEDEDEHHGHKSLLRKRKSNGSDTKSTPARYISIHPNKDNHSLMPALWRIVGTFIALLLTLIPAALIAAGDDPSYEATRASILGCKPMRIVYRQDDNSGAFQCAGGCVPLSRTKVAQKKEGMHDGRCDTIGFRCIDSAGTMILRKYELDVGLYSVPLSDGSCASTDDDAKEPDEDQDANGAANNQAA